MANAVRMPEHGINSLVSALGVAAAQQRVAKVGQRVQPWTINFFDDLNEEERVFADGIIVFTIKTDVLRLGLLDHAVQRFYCARMLRFRFLATSNVGPTAG